MMQAQVHNDRESRRRTPRPAARKISAPAPAPVPAVTSLRELRGYRAEELASVAELGYLLYTKGQLADARVVFEGLAAIDPTHEYYARALSTITLALGDLEAAFAAASKCVELAADPTTALLLRAEILLAASRPAQAAADLERVLKDARAARRAPFARLLYERARSAAPRSPKAR